MLILASFWSPRLTFCIKSGLKTTCLKSFYSKSSDLTNSLSSEMFSLVLVSEKKHGLDLINLLQKFFISYVD